MTRAGVLGGGGLAFIALTLACVMQQRGRLGALETLRAPDLPYAIERAPTPSEPGRLPPMLRAEFDGAGLVLTGRIPDVALRDAIVGNARRLYGAGHVADRLKVVPTTPVGWLNGAFPPDLRETRRAVALLQDGRLLVSGETATDLARSRVDAALKATSPSSWQLDLRLNSADVETLDATAPLHRAGSTATPRATPTRP